MRRSMRAPDFASVACQPGAYCPQARWFVKRGLFLPGCSRELSGPWSVRRCPSEGLALPFAPAVAIPLEDFPCGMDVPVIVIRGIAPVRRSPPGAWKEDLEDTHCVAVSHGKGV